MKADTTYSRETNPESRYVEAARRGVSVHQVRREREEAAAVAESRRYGREPTAEELRAARARARGHAKRAGVEGNLRAQRVGDQLVTPRNVAERTTLHRYNDALDIIYGGHSDADRAKGLAMLAKLDGKVVNGVELLTDLDDLDEMARRRQLRCRCLDDGEWGHSEGCPFDADYHCDGR